MPEDWRDPEVMQELRRVFDGLYVQDQFRDRESRRRAVIGHTIFPRRGDGRLHDVMLGKEQSVALLAEPQQEGPNHGPQRQIEGSGGLRGCQAACLGPPPTREQSYSTRCILRIVPTIC